jgi:hypothetical protein
MDRKATRQTGTFPLKMARRRFVEKEFSTQVTGATMTGTTDKRLHPDKHRQPGVACSPNQAIWIMRTETENKMKKLSFTGALMACALAVTGAMASEDPSQWITFDGFQGPGVGKHIVLIAGDEEYRSEEGLPQMAKILATQHGFKCTVVFPIDPERGIIQPNYQKNIPGLHNLDTADLMVIATRFRNLPDSQMAHIDAFLKTGNPVIGMRTATHAFNMGGNYARYSFNFRPGQGDSSDWAQGFGRLVLGETWINHHGHHKHQACRGVLAPGVEDHPLTRGIEDGDVWGPTDVYGVRLPLPGDSKPVILGQVTERAGDFDPQDKWFGMRPGDKPLPSTNPKNNPLMPVAWTKSYQVPGGKPGQSFCTTMGSSTDLESEGLRRLLVNAVYYLLDMEVPAKGTRVDLVGNYQPSQYGFHKDEHFIELNRKPVDFRMKY